MTDIRDAAEEACMAPLFRGACADCVFERLRFQTPVGAGGIGLGCPPGGMCRQVAFPRPHLVDACGNKLAHTHKEQRV